MASKYSESPPLPRRKFRQYQVNSGQPRKEVIAEEGPQRLSLSILSNLNSPLSLARKQLNQFIFSSKTINQLQTKALSKNSESEFNCNTEAINRGQTVSTSLASPSNRLSLIQKRNSSSDGHNEVIIQSDVSPSSKSECVSPKAVLSNSISPLRKRVIKPVPSEKNIHDLTWTDSKMHLPRLTQSQRNNKTSQVINSIQFNLVSRQRKPGVESSPQNKFFLKSTHYDMLTFDSKKLRIDDSHCQHNKGNDKSQSAKHSEDTQNGKLEFKFHKLLNELDISPRFSEIAEMLRKNQRSKQKSNKKVTFSQDKFVKIEDSVKMNQE